ncbi:MAG TPA: RNA 2',3'-cyclic phosphodiesterase [Actinomycetota bacterium]|nr:RNA 2',3'-cyclic phosphodiesterase [Actinomycetota bacterium]
MGGASRSEARPLRLFVALVVPGPVRELVDSAVEPIRRRYPMARWVPPQNQHVTLKFLGATWPRLLGWVTGAVEGVARASRPFSSRVVGLGAFPSWRRARVLWAGLDDADGRMSALAADLERALAGQFAPERRGFTPHLTVARFDPPVELDASLVRGREPASEAFPVDRVVLFRSYLRRPAPVYEAVREFPLGD